MSDINRVASAASIVLGILLFISFIIIVANVPFPYKYLPYGQFVRTTFPDDIGPSMSDFLWHYRGFDLLMQTLVLFATSLCCLAMLRKELR